MSEWKTDKDGRRYREIGKGCYEYEMDVLTSRGTVPKSGLFTVNSVKESKNRINLTPKISNQTCPFRKKGNCRDDCALRVEAGCGIVNGGQPKGRFCPFSSVGCGQSCALYGEGKCKLLEGRN